METLKEEHLESDTLTDEQNEQDENIDDKEIDTEEQVTDSDSIDEELELTKKALTETESRLLRLQADFDNYRRRTRLDQESGQKYRAQSLITDLLPALDNFERALKIDSDDEQVKNLLHGMEMVYDQIFKALEQEGVEPIKSVGEPFDPHFHQAVMQVEDDEYDSNVVVEELQKGYKLKDRVVRPSMVKVNQ
ncbi:nucleotide exchange factor GrpE [Bacillus carboniphilus]|uniref:Protein GrpE n=1 Tax=Bacillus carboniphilus TaxID=86663 RepID=A0ABY9K3C4_9BACI|nr:nucleotide exchange factor GrpE [Bacillus carboniphilus]WLR44285.1 nucleotide exchange factor GrpE [Bacillus carboniphilus]